MIYVDELIKANVDNISTVERPVYFMHGHPIEIVQELQKLAQDQESKAKRFPLVALFRDFNERKGVEVGVASEATLNLIIATRTQPEYNSNKRKELSFKAVLHPIWEELEQAIMWDAKNYLTNGTGLDYTQIDRYFWGREGLYGNDGNIFNDYIDCVEIRNLNLKIKTPNC